MCKEEHDDDLLFSHNLLNKQTHVGNVKSIRILRSLKNSKRDNLLYYTSKQSVPSLMT
jgi:hypothetical protein